MECRNTAVCFLFCGRDECGVWMVSVVRMGAVSFSLLMGVLGVCVSGVEHCVPSIPPHSIHTGSFSQPLFRCCLLVLLVTICW